MSYDPNSATVEERITELEAICEKQGKRIRTLVAVFSVVSPLKRLMDGRHLLDIFYDDEAHLRCVADCGIIFDKAKEDALGDQGKIDDALVAFLGCESNCP